MTSAGILTQLHFIFLNRLVLTNITSNLRLMLDKNAFVMIIIPFENKLLQFERPCNLLNYLLFVSNIYLFFLAFPFYSCFVLFLFLLRVWLISLRWSWPAERPGSDDGGAGVDVEVTLLPLPCLFCFAVHTSVHLQVFSHSSERVGTEPLSPETRK